MAQWIKLFAVPLTVEFNPWEDSDYTKLFSSPPTHTPLYTHVLTLTLAIFKMLRAYRMIQWVKFPWTEFNPIQLDWVLTELQGAACLFLSSVLLHMIFSVNFGPHAYPECRLPIEPSPQPNGCLS